MGRSARLFFAAAVLLAIGWGVLEGFLYLGRRPPADCDVLSEIDLPGDYLLSSTTDGFLIYRSLGEQISLVRAAAGDSRLEGVSVLKTTPLRCEKPAYTCFMPKDKGGPSSLKPFFAQDDLALVADDQGAVHPVRLGAAPARTVPIKICGHSPNPLTAKFFSGAGRLGVFEPETGRLGLWTLMNFEGSPKGHPGREPDELWKVSFPDGLARLSCEDTAPPPPADMALVSNRLILLVAPPNSKPTLLSFLIDPGVSPDPDWKSPVEGVSRMWTTSPRKLVIASSASDRLRSLTFDEKGALSASEDLLSKVPRDPLVRVVEAGGRALVVFSNRVLSRVGAELSSSKDIAVLPAEDRKVHRDDIGAQGWFDRGEGRGVWARQKGDQLGLTALKCRPHSESKKDNSD